MEGKEKVLNMVDLGQDEGRTGVIVSITIEDTNAIWPRRPLFLRPRS
jgi:hypothetical protein